MGTNYYFGDGELSKHKVEILEKSSLAGSKGSREQRKPTVVIRYEGNKKELVFPHQFLYKMDSFNSVEIEVENGFFGFKTIKNTKLL
jgi:hypothetical protein